MSDIFSATISRVHKIKEIINLSEAEVDLLLNHKKISHQELEVNGNKYLAWRIIHNNALGPGKGGIRFHPNVSEDEVKSLSFWMSIKNSLAGLPYGGAKGGVSINPKEKDQVELEAVSRAFVKAFHPVLGSSKDIPAPDVYTNSQIMAWMLDEYEQQVGYHDPGMITGKPLELGGLALRADATAEGGKITIDELVKSRDWDPRNVTVAVQGFGNAGSFIAEKLHADGFKVVGISDSRVAVYNQAGIDIKIAQEHKITNKTLLGLQNVEEINNDKLLELEVDILVLAALENQITENNVENIKAKVIVELANGPITEQADSVLFNNGITVIPDILANSGGVIVSYFEWAQNKVGNVLDNKYLEKKLNSIMQASISKVHHTFAEYEKKYDLRTCAYILAIKRILAAEKMRGNLK